jgi:citrate:succinate antiporter
MGVMFLIPVPDGMPPQAWHYFAVFVAMIVGMIPSQFRQQRSALSP